MGDVDLSRPFKLAVATAERVISGAHDPLHGSSLSLWVAIAVADDAHQIGMSRWLGIRARHVFLFLFLPIYLSSTDRRRRNLPRS
jgi:hypothetical protein